VVLVNIYGVADAGLDFGGAWGTSGGGPLSFYKTAPREIAVGTVGDVVC